MFKMKNVTKSNFEASMSGLRGIIRAADFVAIDLEMSGIESATWRKAYEFDRHDVRYLKIKDSAEKFAVLQFGVCPFRWNHPDQRFISHPHNFYVFPTQDSQEFLWQTSSIDFLAKHQFDFNTCINQGVSYLSRVHEAEALRSLSSPNEDELSKLCCNLKEAKDIPLDRMSDVFFVERMRNKISEWRSGLLMVGSDNLHARSNYSKQEYETTFYKMRPALMLKGFTSHQMKLIQLVTEKHFENLAYVRATSADSCLQHLIVYTHSNDDRNVLLKELKNEVHKEAEIKINSEVGFRQVIDLLSSEQKLIVGHNCFLDIAHIYSKFLGQLPMTVEEFVKSIHEYFPFIIDTKVLLNSNNGLQNVMKKGGTSLSKSFDLLCPQLASSVENSMFEFKSCVKVEVQVDDMSSCNWNSGTKHEAGYDSFMTGCVFAQACTHLGIDFNLHAKSADLAYDKKLKDQMNLLYLSWLNGELIYLAGGCLVTQYSVSHKKRCQDILFSNIVLIWGFQKLKANDIRESISKVFGSNSVVSLFHLDETAVFVQFKTEEMVSEFLNLKETLEKNDDILSVLHPFSVLFEGGKTRVSNYEVYKEICSSRVSRALFADQAEVVIGNQWKP